MTECARRPAEHLRSFLAPTGAKQRRLLKIMSSINESSNRIQGQSLIGEVKFASHMGMEPLVGVYCLRTVFFRLFQNRQTKKVKYAARAARDIHRGRRAVAQLQVQHRAMGNRKARIIFRPMGQASPTIAL